MCCSPRRVRLSANIWPAYGLKGFNLLSRNAIEVDYPVSIGDRSAW